MTQPETFGEWLKKRRKALGLTQFELAERIGCSDETIRKIESDTRRPSKQIAELLAQCLRVSEEDRPALLLFARSRGELDRFPLPNAPQAPSAEVTAPPPRERTNLPAWPTSFVGR